MGAMAGSPLTTGCVVSAAAGEVMHRRGARQQYRMRVDVGIPASIDRERSGNEHRRKSAFSGVHWTRRAIRADRQNPEFRPGFVDCLENGGRNGGRLDLPYI